jgi:hypothetical protein
MGVNSAFKGFFNNRLAVGTRVALVILSIFLIASSFTNHSDRDLRVKQLNLVIRQIGHRLLLQAGDSTSRVLPVTETKEGTFLLRFENEFVFNHDSLMMLTYSSFPKTQFPSGYILTVHECVTASIVYGFQINKMSPDLLACRGRSQPSGCYTIEITFPDLYVAQKGADPDQRTDKQLSKLDPREANQKPEPSSIKADLEEADRKLAEVKSLSVDPQQANAKVEESKRTNFDYPTISLVFSGMLVLLSVTLLIGRFKKIPRPMPLQNRAMLKESVPEVSALGKFLFDVKDQRLLLGSEVISLTDKECRILELLNENFGELIPRETLMQKVWINEGVITGRSLDMFVSKLRKKLCGDPELRITNVHGKGYKLEIPGVPVV